MYINKVLCIYLSIFTNVCANYELLLYSYQILVITKNVRIRQAERQLNVQPEPIIYLDLMYL
jgi:hypothetical protein